MQSEEILIRLVSLEQMLFEQMSSQQMSSEQMSAEVAHTFH
jgi:hypothetical protein